MTWETNHIPKPRPIRAQNNRAFGDAVRMLRTKATVAHNKTTFWRMSPKAVSPKPRGAASDTITWTHTNAHNPTVHRRPFWIARLPTLQIVSWTQQPQVLLR